MANTTDDNNGPTPPKIRIGIQNCKELDDKNSINTKRAEMQLCML